MQTVASSTSVTSILVTRRLPEAVERSLRDEFGAVLNPDDHQFSADELREAIRSFDVLLCTLTDGLTRDVVATMPKRARLLANFGVGTNHIDLAAARDAGLVVTNTPGVLTDDTADLTLLLVLAVARRAGEGRRELQEATWGGWCPTHLLGTRVTGATLGIVGFGRIGQAVARRARLGFGMHILYHSPRPAPPGIEEALEVERAESLHSLLARSDFVSLHCPATPATRHLIGAEELARMRPSAFLINTARGDVVDETALIRALEQGTIAGAALDVFENEPRVRDPLRTLPNVFALPHLGSATVDSRVAMGDRVLVNIRAFLRGEDPPDRVA